MHEQILHLLENNANNIPALLGVLLVSVMALGKGADWLVDEATSLSLRSGIPRVIVGATIVSLGTTAPEAFVSVAAALYDQPELALGNAVGSIICDTGLILGVACVMAPLPFDRYLVNRQGWIQFACGMLLVVACVPWANPAAMMKEGGILHMYTGWVFMVLLGVYLVWSIRQTGTVQDEPKEEGAEGDEDHGSIATSVLKLIVAIGIVVVAADFLIGSVELIAKKLEIPKEIIAATVVAFGTSLPELVTAIVAVRKNQGELAVGNVIGADILNVLFVAGAAASVTPEGLKAEPFFFQLQFPTMILVLLIFRIAIFQAKGDKLTRPFGLFLLAVYGVYLIVNVTFIS